MLVLVCCVHRVAHSRCLVVSLPISCPFNHVNINLKILVSISNIGCRYWSILIELVEVVPEYFVLGLQLIRDFHSIPYNLFITFVLIGWRVFEEELLVSLSCTLRNLLGGPL